MKMNQRFMWRVAIAILMDTLMVVGHQAIGLKESYQK